MTATITETSSLESLTGREVTFTAGGKGLITGTKRLDQDGNEVIEGGTEYAVIQAVEGDNSQHCYEPGEYRLRPAR